MNFIRSISAELTKLKYAPIFWLCLLVVLFVNGVVFAASFLDSNGVIQLGKNPWSLHMRACLGIFGVFMFTPFVVMLISTAVFIENHAKGWKYLYATPRVRTSIFYAKLISILFTIVLVILGVIAVNLLTGYILDFILPELEFRHYSMRLFAFLPSYVHVFISLLGVIGIQYFISLRFKGFLIPMSFGIIAYIMGFIIGTTNKPFVLYSPYSYPSIVKDYQMFTIDKIGVNHDYWLSNVEIYSIIIFVVFVGLANILEVRKNVS